MDRHVYRLDADTGKVQWTSPDLGGALVASPTFGPDETIFIGTFANEMVALNATDGAVKWRFQTAGWIWSSVALNSDTIYFGDLKGSFYALEASSGKELWKIQPNGAITGAPLLAEDAIYFTSETGTLHAVNKDGSPLWNQAIGGKLYAPVIMAGDMLLTAPVGGKMLLAALDENGVQKWSFAPEK
jgi:outer membrane protein assembly factor BamB